MYQPMIFTSTRGISRMSLNTGANKWASRAVIVLQLAAWSAVGVVLLQKGVSSLQKVQEPRNSTFESNATALEILKMVKIQEEDDQLAVIPIAESDNRRRSGDDNKLPVFDKNTDNDWEQSFDSMELAHFETSLKTSDWSKDRTVPGDSNVADFEDELTKNSQVEVMKSYTRENSKFLSNFNDNSNRNLIIPERSDLSTSVQSSENKSKQRNNDNKENDKDKSKNSDISQNPNYSNKNNHRVRADDEIEKNVHHEIFENMEKNPLNLPAVIPQEMEKLQNPEIEDIQKSQENKNQDINSAELNSNESQTVASHKRKKTSSWDTRRKIRVTPLSSGGAAAAVAMVAVGSVMLVLGPAVIILRALDERRQERRFLKLSGQDDLPPSYEQATLMDEAPRYSTLSLNTIFGPPPPPSPTPATSARSHPV